MAKRTTTDPKVEPIRRNDDGAGNPRTDSPKVTPNEGGGTDTRPKTTDGS